MITLGNTNNLLALETMLQKSGVLPEDLQLLSYMQIYDWRRGGDECYVKAAEITYRTVDGDHNLSFVEKAILPPFGTSVEERIDTMLERMNLLKDNKVAVPQIYAVLDGVMCQEYLEFSVLEMARSKSLTDDHVGQLRETASALDRLGFRPLGYIRDMRSDGNTLFYVDFGSDLGCPHEDPTTMASTQFKKFLREYGLD